MLKQSMLIWGLVLILGFPLLTVVLAEVIERLNRDNNPLVKFLSNLRRFVLPSLVILLLMRQLLDVPTSARVFQVVETCFWTAVIYTLISLLNGLLTSGRKQRTWQIHVPNLLFQVARASVILGIAAYVLADVWKVNLSQVAAALGVGSLVMALALQDTLSNLVSGFLLIFESPFKVGDWIRVKELEGEVIEINWRAVRLKTWDRDIVIIPNGVLGSETIHNYTLLDPLHAVRVNLTFSFDDRPNLIKQLLQDVALATEGVLSNPLPDVRVFSCKNLTVEYEVKFFINNFAALESIRGDFLSRAYYAAKRSQLTLPFVDAVEYKADIRDFVLKSVDNPEEIAESLRTLPYLVLLDRETIDNLARNATSAYFGRGEQLIESGELDHGFYIILDGRVRLTVADLRGDIQEVTQLSSGDFFGEMLLLPGEPSQVSVMVIDDLKAIVIKPDAVIDLVQKHPRFALEINQFIEERRKAVRLARRREDRATTNTGRNPQSRSIVERLITRG